jgi:hypothetical protein
MFKVLNHTILELWKTLNKDFSQYFDSDLQREAIAQL